jgi:hypothetical protein|tara:strand:+ start:1331 stop:1720 length:390 start_codon:yes stop_codon:yes gene_type:complete
MMTTGEIANYKNAVYDLDITVNDPANGFRLDLMETGSSSQRTLVTFSGYQGYLFDQSGNFFGGYDSGVPFELVVQYDHTNKTFSYYHDTVLMANGLDITGYVTDGKVNAVRFDGYNNGSLSLSVSGVKS